MKPKSLQNRSHAVMSQRHEDSESLDDFPTPPWATRALLKHLLKRPHFRIDMSCLEPACGCGFMSEVLKEQFSKVSSFDIYDYGYAEVQDFLAFNSRRKFDWIITNPPFKSAEEFVIKALPVARNGVAVLVRTVFLESVGRYERLFSKHPPAVVAQFVERVPMVKGRVDKLASTATGYAWLIWHKQFDGEPRMRWIPPCRRSLEREWDYTDPSKRTDNVLSFSSLKKSARKKPNKLSRSVEHERKIKQQRDLFS